MTNITTDDTKIRAAMSPSWLQHARDAARAQAATMPEPVFRYGLGVFFSTREAALPSLPDAAEGSLRIDADGAEVLSFEEAASSERLEGVIRARISAPYADALDAWRAAHAQGVLVRVPSGGSADISITSPCVAASADHVIVVVERGASARITETSERESEGSFRVGRTDVILEDAADARMVCLGTRDAGSREIVRRFADVSADARMTWVGAAFGGAFTQDRIDTSLLGDRAKAAYRSAFFGDGAQRFDIRHSVVHFASGTDSDIISKGALSGNAKAVYRGLVRMRKGTKGVTGAQKEDALLLSPGAEIDAMPDLEIDTDDVRCSHGASAGRLDEQKLFYLRSRGIGREEAVRMAVRGFFAPVLAAAGPSAKAIETELDRRIADIRF